MTQQMLKLDEPSACVSVVGPDELAFATEGGGGKLLAVVYDESLETTVSFVEDKNACSYPHSYYDSNTGKSWNVPANHRLVPSEPVVVRRVRFLVARDPESKLAELQQQVSQLRREIGEAKQKVAGHDAEVAELKKKYELELREITAHRDKLAAIVKKRDEEDRERERAREMPEANRFGQIDIED